MNRVNWIDKTNRCDHRLFDSHKRYYFVKNLSVDIYNTGIGKN